MHYAASIIQGAVSTLSDRFGGTQLTDFFSVDARIAPL